MCTRNFAKEPSLFRRGSLRSIFLKFSRFSRPLHLMVASVCLLAGRNVSVLKELAAFCSFCPCFPAFFACCVSDGNLKGSFPSRSTPFWPAFETRRCEEWSLSVRPVSFPWYRRGGLESSDKLFSGTRVRLTVVRAWEIEPHFSV